MAGDISAEVWLNSHRWDALEEELAAQGSSIEKHLQDYLVSLYTELVPQERQREIDQRIASEREEALREAEARKIFSAFRVREQGQVRLFRTDGGKEFLDAAITLRRYLRREFLYPPTSLADCFPSAEPISEAQFDELAGLRLQNSGKVAGAFDIDMDKGEFAALHIMNGWLVYSVRDVSTAAYMATRKAHTKEAVRWELFLDALEGKELTRQPTQEAEPQLGM